MERIVLTTMCAIINGNGEWVFINRKKSWNGIALPGGHIEGCESITDCVIREIKEETDLDLTEVCFKGITHFYNKAEKERYIVFNFISNSFAGKLKEECDEGQLFWSKPDEVDVNSLAEGMSERFELFKRDNCIEMFAEWDGVLGRITTKMNRL
ncbi:MAG: NUDIX domain-containing protein [Lachnospiraceae bacterium]|nr:NUDIX domain-containing protein [Lachnospiraceae bacterium]